MHTIAIIICLITLPIVLLLYFTASKQQHAKRMRKAGCTYRVIAQRLGVSKTTARNYCLP
jgi:hypothetical protein